jgi:hypothetical protein
MSLLRGTGMRRKSRGSIHERVSAELKRLDLIRTNQSACVHRFSYSPSVRGSICIDCGARRGKAVRS